MKFLSNNSFFSYFWALCLMIVLGISPIQNITASVSSSNMEMKNGMLHSMKHSSHHKKMNNDQNSNLDEDCCKNAQCKYSHCSGTITAMIFSNSNIHFSYTANSIYKPAHLALTHHYTSSLFRPPKI